MGAEQSRPVPAWNRNIHLQQSDEYEASVRHSLQQQGNTGFSFDQQSTRYPSAESLQHARPEEVPRPRRRTQDRHTHRSNERLNTSTVPGGRPGRSRAFTEASRPGGGQATYTGGPVGLAAGGSRAIAGNRPRRHRSAELMSPTYTAEESHGHARRSWERERQQSFDDAERLPTYEEATSEQALMDTAMAASRGQANRFDVIDNSGAHASRPSLSSAAARPPSDSPSPNRITGHRRPVANAPDRRAAATAPAAIQGLRRPNGGSEDTRTRSRRGMTMEHPLQRVNHHVESHAGEEEGAEDRGRNGFTPRPLRRSTFSMIEEMRDQGQRSRREGFDMVVEMMDEEDERRRRNGQNQRHRMKFGQPGESQEQQHNHQFWRRVRGEEANGNEESAERRDQRLRELQRYEASKAYQRW